MFIFNEHLQNRLVQSAKDYINSRFVKECEQERINFLLGVIELSHEPAKLEIEFFELNSIVKEFDFKKLLFEVKRMKGYLEFFRQAADILRFTPDVASIEFVGVRFDGLRGSRFPGFEWGCLNRLRLMRVVEVKADDAMVEFLVRCQAETIELDRVVVTGQDSLATLVCELVAFNPSARSLRVLSTEREQVHGSPTSLEKILKALLKNTNLEVIFKSLDML